jgi:cytochrome c oxidase subunit 7
MHWIQSEIASQSQDFFAIVWTMTFTPIVGTFKRRAVRDIAVGLTLATATGYAFWWGYEVPAINQRKAFYARLEAEKKSG